jgi:hypothetical protein
VTGCVIYLLSGVDRSRLLFTVPYSIIISIQVVHVSLVWRHGPVLCKYRRYMLSFLAFMAAMLVPTFNAYLRPIEDMPFKDAVHCSTVMAAVIFFRSLAVKNGALHRELPIEPRATNLKSSLQAALLTLRLMDAFTDMTLVRVLRDEVRQPSTPLILACMLTRMPCKTLWQP